MRRAALKGNPLHAIPGCLHNDTQDPKWPGPASTPSTTEGQGGIQGPYPAHQSDFMYSPGRSCGLFLQVLANLSHHRSHQPCIQREKSH